MKILLAATHLNKGGLAFYTVNLAKCLKLSGVDTAVLSSGGELETCLERDGIPHIYAPIRTKSEFGPAVWRAVPGMVRTIREQGIHLVHSHTRVTQVMSEAVFRLTGTPYVTTCHGFFKHRRLSRRFLPCWGQKVIAISKSVKDHLVKDMKVSEEKVEMVYNGIDLKQYGNIPEQVRGDVLREIGINEGAMVVGTVGRFSSVKGFRYLVEAFDKAAGNINNLSLLMVGQGPEARDLLTRAARSPFSGRIFLIPGKRPLPEYLAAIDIFCMPSLKEGFGLAAAEAMASGKPCIVSKVGGLTEIVTDGKNGLTVKPASGEELARAIVRLAEDTGLMRRLSEEAVIRSRDFSLEKSVSGTIKVYESVLFERKRGQV
ncbi:MAG: glycosyltransferase family 4 protein [Candidatus Omnitrophota bacterium]